MTLDIYSHLSNDYIQGLPQVTFEKKDIIFPSESITIIPIYYILEGFVSVFTHAINGRCFLVDELEKGEFIGKFSQMRKQNFHSSAVAMTACRLLDLTKDKEKLFQDPRFSLFFNTKTTDRLYRMHKLLMARNLFSAEELLAHCFLELSKNEDSFAADDEYVCQKINISKRNYFYLLKKLRSKEIIFRKGKKVTILNKKELIKTALSVTEYMKNKI